VLRSIGTSRYKETSPFNCNLPEDLNHQAMCFHLADEQTYTRQELEFLGEIKKEEEEASQ